MPEEYERYGDGWAELNPDWDVIMWKFEYPHFLVPHYVARPSGKRLPRHQIINLEVWRSLGSPPMGMTNDIAAMWTQRADVIGYELAYRYGGLYVNTDIEPIRPLADLIEKYPDMNHKAAAAMEDDDWLVNAVLWAPERLNEFYKNVVAMLTARYFQMPHEYMNVTTGPHLLTTVANIFPHLIVPIDKSAFSHVHWSQVRVGHGAEFNVSELPPTVIGVHHWGHRLTGRHQTSWV